jgi:hypothetical protein
MSTKEVKQEITSKIKSGELTMKPKWYFWLGTALLVQGTLGILLISTYVSNLCFYSLRVHGPFGYLLLGKEGLNPFIATFPWKMLIIAGFSLLIGFKLLQKYEFSYTKHSVHIFLMLIATILIAGLLTDLAGFNEKYRFHQYLNPVYSERFMGQDWMMGEVRQRTEDGFVLETPSGELVRVRVDKRAVTPFGKDYDIEKRVRVVGQMHDNASTSAIYFEAKAVGMDEGMRWRRSQVKGANTHTPRRMFLVK